VGKLLDLYRNDPDAGIHGAAQWTLRRWGQRDKLMAVDADLMKVKNRGDRRWFVNSLGQTFVVVEGPVAYRMGSMPTETERHISEKVPRRMVIPRRFAIASQEVSVKQFEEFRRENPLVPRDQALSPDPDCPQTSVSWCTAAAYCNWLSRREGLPECYVSNAQGQYHSGMKIKADFLLLGGYRLPTEAEWEYACRAGAETTRYYGATLDLLGRYAWHRDKAQERSHPCGSLLPNDLGLFDMLGNVFESCQEDDEYYQSILMSVCIDILSLQAYVPVRVTDLRVLRGGCFVMRADLARSAAINFFAPTSAFYGDGLRPVRTLP
jgi:formylglycine-generating enzyme required for sulfatase activity